MSRRRQQSIRPFCAPTTRVRARSAPGNANSVALSFPNHDLLPVRSAPARCRSLRVGRAKGGSPAPAMNSRSSSPSRPCRTGSSSLGWVGQNRGFRVAGVRRWAAPKSAILVTSRRWARRTHPDGAPLRRPSLPVYRVIGSNAWTRIARTTRCRNGTRRSSPLRLRGAKPLRHPQSAPCSFPQVHPLADSNRPLAALPT